METDITPTLIREGMMAALMEARKFLGSTAPNPPVGAVGFDAHGKLLAAASHQRAGEAHAEVRLMQALREKNCLSELRTLMVTLEPCDHFGKTPPCTLEIINQKQIQTVVVGCHDPNPKVNGKGIEHLRAVGLKVIDEIDHDLQAQCRSLIAPFAHRTLTGRPWITLKLAVDQRGSPIPPPGQKTFSSESSLTLAHQLRKKADAILTGSGTIIKDDPLFNVRRVPDYNEKKRFLVLMDRRGRVADSWLESASQRGLLPIRGLELEAALDYLGKQGVSEVLVEAGPTLTQTFLEKGLWNNQIIIHQGKPNEADQIEIKGPRGVAECLPVS